MEGDGAVTAAVLSLRHRHQFVVQHPGQVRPQPVLLVGQRVRPRLKPPGGSTASRNERIPAHLVEEPVPALAVPGVHETNPEPLQAARHLHVLWSVQPGPAQSGVVVADSEPADRLPAEDVPSPARHVDLVCPGQAPAGLHVEVKAVAAVRPAICLCVKD